MQTQLTLDFTSRPPKQKLIIKNTTWMNVSDVARGIGFTIPVEVSIALSDALEPLQTEDHDDYDQRLYDALWLAHHYLSLDCQRESITFTFDFLREDKHTGKFIEASPRLRAETQKQVVLVGLMQDF
ncbi:MAG: hypothetical protein HY863_09335 [Chloroflexi bacterium]|nr:hypothetical protein [Chloroflexota bacterium]